jgi:Zn-dependent protease
LSVYAPAIELCPQCATQLAPQMTVCPGCGKLVHSDRLTNLAQTAKEAEDRGDISSALSAWREALALLPPGSRQAQIISSKITELGRQHPSIANIPSDRTSGTTRPRSGIAAVIGLIVVTLLKLKTILFGLSNVTTLLTMLVSLGAYWTIFGWKFALGLVLSIYVHEMGHVIVLRKYGFKATAPMFIPGLGAVIRLQQHVVNPREDAEIGLAGPVYGLGAALFSLALWYVTGRPIFAAVAGLGAWINLFNLVPLFTLDGGRGFHAMSRLQKFLCAATVGASWYLTNDGLLMVIGLVCVYRAAVDRSEKDGNWKAAITYILLVIALTAVSVARYHSGVPR